MFSAMVADAAPILIGYLDRQQRYRFVNRAYEEWFGVDRTNLEGKTLVQVLGEAGYDKVKDHVARALAGERVTFEGEVPYRDAGLRHIEAQWPATAWSSPTSPSASAPRPRWRGCWSRSAAGP